MPVIRGRHNKRQIFLDVVILDVKRDSDVQNLRNDVSIPMEPLRALVDTGATATSITPSAAERLSLRIAGQRRVLTAGGNESVTPYYFFSLGFCYPMALDPLSEPAAFHVLPDPVIGSELIFDNSPFDILLGMDVISQGDLKIFRNGEFMFELS